MSFKIFLSLLFASPSPYLYMSSACPSVKPVFCDLKVLTIYMLLDLSFMYSFALHVFFALMTILPPNTCLIYRLLNESKLIILFDIIPSISKIYNQK